MKNTMGIKYINGLNNDRVEVSIFDNNKKTVFFESYAFGYNASYNRNFAKIAEADHFNSIKYGWSHSYPLKPFIGDILNNLCKKYDINKEEIDYSGIYVFMDRGYTEEEAKELMKLFEDK